MSKAKQVCDRCGEAKSLETYSYRVVSAEGTINLDVHYCSDCCDEIEQQHREELNEQNAQEVKV